MMKHFRIHFDEIDSTNNWVKEHSDQLDPNCLTIVTSDGQTSGRGQFERKWVSPKGVNLYISYAFIRPSLDPFIGHVPQVLALAAAELLSDLGFPPTLKWPNDILLAGKKVGGILTETMTTAQGVVVIVGVGMNVNMTSAHLDQVDQAATSLLVESGKEWERGEVLTSLSQRFSSKLEQLFKEGFSPFLTAFQNWQR